MTVLYVKKAKCPHTEAKIYDNGDWTWLVCTSCGKEVNEERYVKKIKEK